MSIIRLTKEFRFEMAHVLSGYDGPCSNMHGHSYILNVTVIGEPIKQKDNTKLGMVIDFNDLDSIVNQQIISKFDHAVSVMHDTPIFNKLTEGKFANVVALPFQPTCENLLPYFAKLISDKLPSEVRLHHLRLHETATSFAEWFADDNQQ